jgi:hypothetical protein
MRILVVPGSDFLLVNGFSFKYGFHFFGIQVVKPIQVFGKLSYLTAFVDQKFLDSLF